MELTVNERIANNVEVMEKVKLVDVADIIAGQSPPSDTYNKDIFDELIFLLMRVAFLLFFLL